MIVRNTKQGYATLHFKDGVKSVVYKIMAGETVNIPTLNSVDQVVNKFLFKHGHLAVVEASKIAPAPKAPKKETSEVAKAKEQTEEYIADVNKDGVVDEKDLSIVQKAKSAKKTKTKKSSKKD